MEFRIPIESLYKQASLKRWKKREGKRFSNYVLETVVKNQRQELFAAKKQCRVYIRHISVFLCDRIHHQKKKLIENMK